MGEEGITISDKTQVKVDVFEDEDLMSDEEKAALKEDIEGDPDSKADANQNDQKETDAEKQAEIERADKEIAAQKAEADAKTKTDGQDGAEGAGDEKAAAGSEDGSEDDADADPPILVPQTPPPLSLAVMSAEEVADVEKSMADVKERFKNGEIDYDTWFEERIVLERKLWNNDMAMQLSTEGVENQWKWEQQSFLTSQENEWINADDVVYAAFAATVNRIMSTEEGAIMPGPDLLALAREQVAERFSPTKAEDTAAAVEKKEKAAALAGAKKGQAGKKLPDTLGGMPAAEAEEGVGEFDYLDKLDGEKFEQAVESLTEAQLARYEATQ